MTAAPNVHAWARALLAQAWAALAADRAPETATLQAIQAVALHESNYGHGWKGAMASSNNWGAVQCSHAQDAHGTCPPGCAPATDSHASGVTYGGCFKVYASPLDGCTDLLNWFVTRPDVLGAAATGDAGVFVTAMHDHRYFEGFGNPQQAVEGYDQAVMRAAAILAAALGEPVYLSAHAPGWLPPGLPDV